MLSKRKTHEDLVAKFESAFASQEVTAEVVFEVLKNFFSVKRNVDGKVRTDEQGNVTHILCFTQ